MTSSLKDYIYIMKLVTFGIERKRNLRIQFPIFMQPYTQQPLILYQLETVPVPIVHKILRPIFIHNSKLKALFSSKYRNLYINVRQQEVATCKRIVYEFFCKELFIVRHKSIHSCKSVIYFDLDKDIIKHNCNFIFYCNKTDVTRTVLDRGNEIILANWPDSKCICTVNNDIPIKILSHPYILVNRSVLCNCGTEVENNFLLESLAMFHDANMNLVMFFIVNTALTSYINQLTLPKN